ncbi:MULTISPECIES: SIMPL domain-containing protein [unclassified Bradyrhizobium]|uniref:SIMPL domain-containing protein n=1 Tax=unclassified Bradyrhizobium TaxID=2631580 RepID=UPI002916AAD9|nr:MULTISPECIES: SIMPL domain-containing protein [unclassified Bradyrhizobium]
MIIRPILAVALATSFAMPALADDIARQDTPAITVSGEASVSAPPDLAQIDAGVASDAKTAREAAEANNAAMAKVLQALKAAGIADKDYQTSRLSLQPQYAQNRPAQPAVTGYRASNRVTIKLRDVAKVASVIDTLVAAGANDAGNIYFSVAEPSKLLDQAREKAVADARRKAEIYAKAAGVTLGQPLSISEDGAPAPVFRAKTFAAPMAATPTPVAQGEETLSITVNVTWAIKPGQ